jgi:hypothetical protein
MKYIVVVLTALTSCLETAKVKNGVAYEASDGLILTQDSLTYEQLFQRLDRSETALISNIEPSKKEKSTSKTSATIPSFQIPEITLRSTDSDSLKPEPKTTPEEINEVLQANEPTLTETFSTDIKPVNLKDSVLPLIKPDLDTIWTKIDNGDTEFLEMDTTSHNRKKKKFLFFKNKGEGL